MINNSSEEALVGQLRSGDDNALRLMYSRYIRYLTAVCSRYISGDEDVRDVLQNTFLKIFSSLDKFEFRGEGSLKAWISRILLNEIITFEKQNQKLDFVELNTETMDTPDEDPDSFDIPPEVIHKMIRGLPDGYRTIFNLYVIEEKSHREIAQLLGIKENSSASQLHRAKAMLAEKIRNYKSDQ